ncbi:hypothetical protein COCVIDRAFT_21254 [Bipolaris victoriae FI3]|uniref:BTB domain-containing protein n=1 Tax=Bipolaris victoriae (strain FI3) TaxID=930091 RepID=W7DXD1_BIPV3|nr:hypothetical protein COCVIDRAFT_21254 [Bipolaris victoriae FI3]
MANASHYQSWDLLKSSLASGAYFDINITYGNNNSKLHKVIVCTRTDFFARAVNFGGQLTQVKETKSGTSNLPEDEPETARLLIQYLYEREYEPQLPPTAVTFDHRRFHTSQAWEAVIQNRRLASRLPPYLYLARLCEYIAKAEDELQGT